MIFVTATVFSSVGIANVRTFFQIQNFFEVFSKKIDVFAIFRPSNSVYGHN